LTVAPSPAAIAPGSDATAAFRAAYENRYTWDPGFGGSSGGGGGSAGVEGGGVGLAVRGAGGLGGGALARRSASASSATGTAVLSSFSVPASGSYHRDGVPSSLRS
jgi:hypothetical protein